MNVRFNAPPADSEVLDFIRQKKEEYKARRAPFTTH
jgi:hypothetical protein